MMRKYIFLIAVYACCAANSCKKLDRELVTDITLPQAEKSYVDVSYLINAVYTNMPDGMLYIGTTNPPQAMMASASDEAEFTLENNPVQLFNNGSWNAKNNPDNVWANYFQGIYRANEFLNISNSVNLDQYKLDPAPSSQITYNTRLADIKRWKYEARFLRAYYYFELIKRYGGVPLFKQVVATADVPNIKRNTLEDCVNFITAECDSAASVLTANTAIASTDQGRATKMSALALKSRVLLYAASDLWNSGTNPLLSLSVGDRNTRWKAAADAALDAINEQTNNGVGVTLGAYKTLFNNYNLPGEIIFGKRVPTAANTFEKINYPIGFDQTTGGNTPSQDLVDAYEVKTGTGTTATSVPFDWGNATHTNPANIYNLTYSASTPITRDPRLGFSIGVNNASFQANGITRPLEMFPGGFDAPTKLNGTKTGYYLRKYIFEGLNFITGGTAAHTWIIFRVPELFLNYAEALNEYSPGNPDIKKYYDLVRNRTGVSMPLLAAGLTPDQVRTKIRNEERVEFAFEDHRIWDLRRWMLATTVLNGPLRGVDVSKSGTAFSYQQKIVENRIFTSNMYYYPIPQTEIINSPGLVQNTGW
jgi:hypothetical protein